MLYGADVWYNLPPAKKYAPTLGRRGIAHITKKLTSVQRSGALAITGGLQTSPTDVIDALANLIPFKQVVELWCYRAALRLASLPDMHPLQKPVKRCASGIVKKHRFPLHSLLSMIDTDISNIETKPIEIHNPAKPPQLPFKVNIPPDKESLKRAAQENMDTIQVYTDCEEPTDGSFGGTGRGLKATNSR